MSPDFTLDDWLKTLRNLAQFGTQWPRFATFLRSPKEELSIKETAALLERIIIAMTEEERKRPDNVGPAECDRIATASGVPVCEVRLFLRQAGKAREQHLRLSRMTVWQKIRLMTGIDKMHG